MLIQNNKIFLKPCGVKLYTKDIKYDLSRLSSNKRRFFLVNFLINATFEYLRMQRLLARGDVYFTFPFQNAAFIGGRRVCDCTQLGRYCKD